MEEKEVCQTCRKSSLFFCWLHLWFESFVHLSTNWFEIFEAQWISRMSWRTQYQWRTCGCRQRRESMWKISCWRLARGMATYVSVFRTVSSCLTPPTGKFPVKSHLLVDELNLFLYCPDFPFIVKLADFHIIIRVVYQGSRSPGRELLLDHISKGQLIGEPFW